MRRLLLALIAAVSFPLSVRAAEPAPLLLDQLGAATETRPVMDPWSGQQTGAMFLSHPREIAPGLCRVDVLTPIFNGRIDWSRPLEADARVIGFDAAHYYFKVSSPTGCDGPAPELATMILAPLDHIATMGWEVLFQVRDDARAGSLPVTCDDGPAAGCRAAITAMDVGSLRQIDRCDAREDRADYACFMFVVGGMVLRVTFPVADGPIRRVEVERQPLT